MPLYNPAAHADLATHDALGLATDSELTTHAGAADPHTGYLKETDFDDVDFLVGTATGHTAAEIVVGTAPAGELGGTWASPTVDATHAGGTHLAIGSTSSTAAAGDHTTHLGRNVSAGAQAISANTVTYITNSGILIPTGGIVAGNYTWYIGVSKTAAGTATPVWTPRIGTNQTTADATVLTITSTAQVATLSGTLIIVTCQVRTASATGVIVGSINTGAASFGIGGNVVSGSFDTTGKGGQRFGLCVNTGASAAWTVNSVVSAIEM